jgi:hypothetical protein
MKPNAQNTKRERSGKSPVQTQCTPRVRHLTALKHGLNSGSVLLPGDNVEAFRTLRHREFRLYQPRNIEETRCVETIVAAHWRIERCRVEQRIFKRHLGAVLSGDPDVTGAMVDADPHRLHHRATDCGLEERRLEKSMREAKADLALLQKQRAQSRIVGNEPELEDYAVFMAEGEPVAVEAASPTTGTARAAGGSTPDAPTESCAPTGSSGSNGGGISESLQHTPGAPPDGFAVYWSGHPREPRSRQRAER